MSVLKRPIHIAILLLVGAVSALAAVGDSITLTGDLFGRSSPNFVSQSNISGVVPSGSKATVLETKVMPSGSVGVRVKITSVSGSRGSDTAKVGDETWIYHSKNTPWFDMDGSGAGEPVENSSESEPVRYGVNPGKDPNESQYKGKRKSTEAGYCIDCEKPKTPTPTQSNQAYIKQVAEAVPTFRRKATPLPPPSSSTDDRSGSRWARFPEVRRFSTDRRTLSTIQTVKSNIERGITREADGVPRCYKWVKKALFKNYTGGSAYNSQLPGAYARDGVRDLEKVGWKNMLTDPRYASVLKGDPRNAPKGAIIVYSNEHTFKNRNSSYAGHIEIKESDDTSASYYSFFKGGDFRYSHRADLLEAAGHPLKVIGIMFKPN